MTKEKAKEPQIRFKGFTNAWEQRKLGELANIATWSKSSTYPRSKMV